MKENNHHQHDSLQDKDKAGLAQEFCPIHNNNPKPVTEEKVKKGSNAWGTTGAILAISAMVFFPISYVNLSLCLLALILCVTGMFRSPRSTAIFGIFLCTINLLAVGMLTNNFKEIIEKLF